MELNALTILFFAGLLLVIALYALVKKLASTLRGAGGKRSGRS